MFKGLFRKSDTAERYQDSGEDLGVFTLSLSGVEDPFDPDPLWDRKYGGQAGIAEQMSGDNDFRRLSGMKTVGNCAKRYGCHAGYLSDKR